MTLVELGQALPPVNAALNSISAILLLVGFVAIKRKNIALHRRCMVSAFSVSVLFLVCYLVRVALTGTHRFPGTGLAKTLYYVILFSHMTLAMVNPFLAVRAIMLGRAGRIDEHRRIVRYAWPLWMYVSLTGIVVYVMLYHWPR